MRFIQHMIAYGESLKTISQHYYESPNKWTDLALINELEYPFIDEADSEKKPNVKRVGETILVPVDNPAEFAVIPTSEFDDIFEQAFGEDLSLFESPDLVEITRNTSGEFTSDIYGDLKTVTGIANLRQSLIIRLSTPQGSLLYHPKFGSRLHEIIGSKGVFENVFKSKVEIERCIRTDTRVENVVMGDVTLDGGVLTATVSVYPMGIDKAFALNFKFGERGVIGWD